MALLTRREVLQTGAIATGVIIGKEIFGPFSGLVKTADASSVEIGPLDNKRLDIKTSLPLPSSEIPLSFDNLKGEANLLFQGATQKKRFCEAYGEYIKATGQTFTEEGIDLVADFVSGSVEALTSKSDPTNYIIDSYFVLKGLYYGRDVLLKKLNETKVDDNGNISGFGNQNLAKSLANKFSRVIIDNDNNLNGNHASFSLAVKSILVWLSYNDPYHNFDDLRNNNQMGDLLAKDVNKLKACYRGLGIFEDTAGNPPFQGHIGDLYNTAIIENIDFVRNLPGLGLDFSWLSENDIKSYIDSCDKIFSEEGIAMPYGRSTLTVAADPPAIESVRNLSTIYRPDLLGHLNYLLKQSFARVNDGFLIKDQGYVQETLSPNATGFDGYNNRSDGPSANVAITATRAIARKNVNFDEDPRVDFGPKITESGVLVHRMPNGTKVIVTPRLYDVGEDISRYGTRINIEWLRQEAKAWLPLPDNRPIIYGIPMIRYKEGAPGNFCFLTQPTAYNLGTLGPAGFAYYEGFMTEYAKDIQPRKAPLFAKAFVVTLENKVFTVYEFKSMDNNIHMTGISDTSLPLRGKDTIKESSSSGRVKKITRGIYSISGKPLFPSEYYDNDLIYGGDPDQKNPFDPTNRSLRFGRAINANEKRFYWATQWSFAKGTGIDLTNEDAYVTKTTTFSNQVKIELKDGLILMVDFNSATLGEDTNGALSQKNFSSIARAKNSINIQRFGTQRLG